MISPAIRLVACPPFRHWPQLLWMPLNTIPKGYYHGGFRPTRRTGSSFLSKNVIKFRGERTMFECSSQQQILIVSGFRQLSGTESSILGFDGHTWFRQPYEKVVRMRANHYYTRCSDAGCVYFLEPAQRRSADTVGYQRALILSSMDRHCNPSPTQENQLSPSA